MIRHLFYGQIYLLAGYNLPILLLCWLAHGAAAITELPHKDNIGCCVAVAVSWVTRRTWLDTPTEMHV